MLVMNSMAPITSVSHWILFLKTVKPMMKVAKSPPMRAIQANW